MPLDGLGAFSRGADDERHGDGEAAVARLVPVGVVLVNNAPGKRKRGTPPTVSLIIIGKSA